MFYKRNNLLIYTYLLSILCVFFSVVSSISAKPVSKEIQLQVFELLNMDCGMDGTLKDFKASILKLPADVTPLFTQILDEGAPEQAQNQAVRQAKINYELRQAWLRKNGTELFDKDTIKRLSNTKLDDYIARSKENINLRYQQNSIRGLGYIGNYNTIELINKSVKKNPDYQSVAEQAIKSIKAREKSK